jgi:hypothetical protein
VWQFAQSPRRREFTARCAASYDKTGNCYPPELENLEPAKILLDLDTANSPDPSNGR